MDAPKHEDNDDTRILDADAALGRRRLARSVTCGLLVWCGCWSAACRESDDRGSYDTDVLSHLPQGVEQLEHLCARGHTDAVARTFCGSRARAIQSIADVQDLLGLSFDDESPPAFSLVGHSSALPSRSVTAVNPGSVVVSLPRGIPPDGSPINGDPGRRREDGNILSMAFARGDQLVELAVTPPDGELRLYLLRYQQPCNSAEERAPTHGALDQLDDSNALPALHRGCTPADLLTEETERGWTGWSLYDDSDLANTVLDCLHCHQPEGPGTPRIYRLQEVENPWTHWMASFTLGGRVLLDDTIEAHGLEGTVAGVPGRFLARSNPVVVEDLIRFAGSAQPNVFPAPEVEREVMASSPAQPADNGEPGTSAAWQEVYARAVRGEAIPPPYHDVKVTDPDKLASATRALRAHRAGSLEALPDIRDVFDDDALPGMSHRPMSGLSGREILVHACAQCHNPRLDQGLSRAGFDALRLDALSAAQREHAVERMLLPPDHRGHMPPRLFRALSAEERAAAIEALLRP